MPSERPVLLLSDFLFHVAGAFRGPVELSVVFSCCPFERCSGLEGEFEGNAITAGEESHFVSLNTGCAHLHSRQKA